jgi:hypothetical protein
MPKGKNCACGREAEDVSCFKINELRIIAKHIRLSGGEIEDGSKQVLYESILNALSCDGDRCLTVHDKLSPDIQTRLKEALVPVAPREWINNPTEWLSNFDIEKKCTEMVRPKKTVLFLGVFPMDAEHKMGARCVSRELCDYHPVASRRKYPTFAAVFNTDYHSLPGSHWVSLMGFVRPKDPRYGLYYYDSLGNRPTGDIDHLITRLSNELAEADGAVPPYMFNDVRHQSSNTECGMFCLAFIDSMLHTNRTYPEMCKRLVTDAEMIKKRTEYFELPSKNHLDD